MAPPGRVAAQDAGHGWGDAVVPDGRAVPLVLPPSPAWGDVAPGLRAQLFPEHQAPLCPSTAQGLNGDRGGLVAVPRRAVVNGERFSSSSSWAESGQQIKGRQGSAGHCPEWSEVRPEDSSEESGTEGSFSWGRGSALGSSLPAAPCSLMGCSLPCVPAAHRACREGALGEVGRAAGRWDGRGDGWNLGVSVLRVCAPQSSR